MHTFTLPFGGEYVAKVRITYAQGNEIKITKELSDVTISNNAITVKLTQEDTLKLDHKQRVHIQLQVLTPSNEALVSKIIVKDVDDCLSNEVL